MGLSSFIGLGKATDRILERYGIRSGTIINATGTGTTVILWVSPKDNFDSEEHYNETVHLVNLCTAGQSDGFIEISAFSNEIEPIRFSSTSQMDYRRALSGRIHGYHKYDDIMVSIGVIGNSLDDYRLTTLSTMASKRRDFMPLFDLQVMSNSAPGYEGARFECGVIEGHNPGLNIGANSKIRDKVFTFKFSSFKPPYWSDQKYDPTNTPNILTDMIGY